MRSTHPRTQESTELARRHARVNAVYGFLWAHHGRALRGISMPR